MIIFFLLAFCTRICHRWSSIFFQGILLFGNIALWDIHLFCVTSFVLIEHPLLWKCPFFLLVKSFFFLGTFFFFVGTPFFFRGNILLFRGNFLLLSRETFHGIIFLTRSSCCVSGNFREFDIFSSGCKIIYWFGSLSLIIKSDILPAAGSIFGFLLEHMYLV